jgi:hypothetical protein
MTYQGTVSFGAIRTWKKNTRVVYSHDRFSPRAEHAALPLSGIGWTANRPVQPVCKPWMVSLTPEEWTFLLMFSTYAEWKILFQGDTDSTIGKSGN